MPEISNKEHFSNKRHQQISRRVGQNMYFDPVAYADIILLLDTVRYQRGQMTSLIKKFIRVRMMIENWPPPPWKRKGYVEDV